MTKPVQMWSRVKSREPVKGERKGVSQAHFQRLEFLSLLCH